jgi:hypothetical protein
MEFGYFGLDKVVTGPKRYDWSAVDRELDGVASRKRHLVLRFYIDFPGKETALPGYLRGKVRLTRYSVDAGGLSPDYENKLLVEMLVDFVAALAARYDGDRRLGCVMVGLVGMFGEWHTLELKNLMASRDTQWKVLEAFDRGFTKTKVLVSADELDQWAPGAARATSRLNIGWHDDNFAVGTYIANKNEDWFWYPRAKSHGLLEAYTTRMMGGELQPTVQKVVFAGNYKQPFLPAAAAMHVSWLLNDFVFLRDGNASRARASLAGHLAMGYQFFLARATMSKSNLLTLTVENRGNAPFYYDLKVSAHSPGAMPIVIDDPVSSEGVRSGGKPSSRQVSAMVPVSRDGCGRVTVLLSLVSSMLLPGQHIAWANQPGGAQDRAKYVRMKNVISTAGVFMFGQVPRSR